MAPAPIAELAALHRQHPRRRQPRARELCRPGRLRCRCPPARRHPLRAPGPAPRRQPGVARRVSGAVQVSASGPHRGAPRRAACVDAGGGEGAGRTASPSGCCSRRGARSSSPIASRWGQDSRRRTSAGSPSPTRCSCRSPPRPRARRRPIGRKLFPLETKLLQRYLADRGIARLPATLGGYTSTVVTPTLEAQRQGGASPRSSRRPTCARSTSSLPTRWPLPASTRAT